MAVRDRAKSHFSGAALLNRAHVLIRTLPALSSRVSRQSANGRGGWHGNRRVGDGTEFWQFRPYAPGDAVHRVDWRQSARREAPLIREREAQSARQVLLWCDLSASMITAASVDTDMKAHRASEMVLAMALLANRAGEYAFLLTPSMPVHSTSQMAEHLAGSINDRLQAGFQETAAAVLPRWGARRRVGDRAVLFTDGYMALEELEVLLKHGPDDGCLVQVTDPAERDWPYRGRGRFVDPEDGRVIVLNRAEAHAQAVRESFDRHRAGLADLCRSRGWQFVSHEVSQAATTPLLALNTWLMASGNIR